MDELGVGDPDSDPGVGRGPAAEQLVRIDTRRVVHAGCEALVVTVAGEIDMLLTDVVMPGMSGRQVADIVCEGTSGLRVLFMSGYTDDAIVRNGVLEAKDHFLAKPFTARALLERTKELLGE